MSTYGLLSFKKMLPGPSLCRGWKNNIIMCLWNTCLPRTAASLRLAHARRAAQVTAEINRRRAAGSPGLEAGTGAPWFPRAEAPREALALAHRLPKGCVTGRAASCSPWHSSKRWCRQSPSPGKCQIKNCPDHAHVWLSGPSGEPSASGGEQQDSSLIHRRYASTCAHAHVSQIYHFFITDFLPLNKTLLAFLQQNF